KGGNWFSLIDKVYLEANLIQSTHKVVQNQGAAGVDHVTVDEFERNGRRGRGSDHQRWKNSFFATAGLFSLVEAHRVACQSSLR
ncbi:Retron-type RNA-directed DNA polymerase, partial [hydrothermal vent metagenome]